MQHGSTPKRRTVTISYFETSTFDQLFKICVSMQIKDDSKKV